MLAGQQHRRVDVVPCRHAQCLAQRSTAEDSRTEIEVESGRQSSGLVDESLAVSSIPSCPKDAA